jgi:hypothetical protein
MRRFVTLAVLFLFTIPFGISISGCSKGSPAAFCNGGDTGPLVGQVTSVTLTPRIFGVSLNQGQIGQVASPQAADCNGNSVSVSTYTYGVFDANGQQSNALIQVADVVPSGVNAGKLCAGNWNRNTGGGIPDFTTCNVTGKAGVVYVVASGGGSSSNPLPIFVHPKVSSVVLGTPTPATACAATDADVERQGQSSNCCQLSKQAPVTADNVYDGTSCVSQTKSTQLAARAYDATGANVTCQVGHLNFAAQSSTIVTIDENGIATAQQPGSTIVSADLTQAGSSAGFFSTCPPTSIQLTVPSSSGNVKDVVVNQNTPQPLTAVATDKTGQTLTGLAYTFVSTTPITIPATSSGSITPVFPGAAAITALCQPPSCNSSPQNAIGLFGNGKPIASDPVTVTTPGANSTLLWIGSTQSRYLLPIDFTNAAQPAPVRLPFAPNSMVISNDGSSIYMGTPTELMVFNAATNSLSREDPTVAGQVLAVSPDGGSLIISDPRRKLIYLYSTATSSGTETGTGTGTGTGTTATTATSNYGGVATHAQFTQDNQTVYITLGAPDPSDPTNPDKFKPTNQLLVHSTFTGWSQIGLPNEASDVAITVPSVGAYLAGAPTTARSYCSTTTVNGTGTDQTVTNLFYPLADTVNVTTDRVAATNNGLHILGATTSGGGSVSDLTFSTALPPAPPADPNNPNPVPGACPSVVADDYFSPSRGSLNTYALGVTADRITGVLPTSDSSVAFVTYTGTGALPAYTPATGTVTPITLTGATAPVVGTISSDNLTLYVGTSGDNKVHLIDTKTLTDAPSRAVTPNLPLFINSSDNPSTIVTPNLIVQYPRKATS